MIGDLEVATERADTELAAIGLPSTTTGNAVDLGAGSCLLASHRRPWPPVELGACVRSRRRDLHSASLAAIGTAPDREQLQIFVQPLRSPSFPAEAPAFPGSHQIAPPILQEVSNARRSWRHDVIVEITDGSDAEITWRCPKVSISRERFLARDELPKLFAAYMR